MELMKNIYRIPALLALACLFACTGDFSHINHSGTITPEEAKGDYYYIGMHFQTLQTRVIQAGQNAYQFNENLTGQPYARYLTITKDNWNTENFCVFNAPRNWLNSLFNDQMVGVYSTWFELKRILTEEERLDHFTWAWAELLRVAAVHRATDMYGPLPYSKIKEDADGLYVEYDTQEQVYDGMFEDLNKAIEILTDYVQSGAANEVSAFKQYDMVYNGDFTKWLKFANSLKLRMAMRIAFVDKAKAAKYAEEAIMHPIGLIETNEDNARLTFDPNPLYIMYGPYEDTRACAEIMTYLKGYQDPRLAAYFVPAEESGEYRAMRMGIAISSHDWATRNFSNPNVSSTDPLIWMTAAEVAFLKAEARAYWKWDFITESAGDLYNSGVKLSFQQWQVQGYDQYINNSTLTQESYGDDNSNGSPALSSITIKWDDNSQDEVKLERIITQKWIALYPLGHEAWAEHRRTGYPRFFSVPVVNNTDNSLSARGASRIPYGPDESLYNEQNYNDAVNKSLGGRDDYGIRLWWDVKGDKPGW